jgi:O-antigen/teichoic acid export membrane protein
VAARSFTGALGIVASLLLYRVLGPYEAGRFQFVSVLAMSLGNIAALGFLDTLARFVPGKAPEVADGHYRRAIRLTLIGLAAGGVLFFGLLQLPIRIPSELRETAVLFYFGTASYALFAVSLGMLRGQGRLLIIPRIDLVFNSGAKTLALIVALTAPFLFPVFLAHTAVQIGVFLGVLLMLRRSFRHPEVRFSSAETRFCRLVLFGEAVRVLVMNIDIYLLRVLLGPDDVGIYAAGTRITRVGEQLILGPLMVPLLYYFSHPDSAFIKQRVMTMGTRLAGVFVGLVALGVAMLAEPIVTIFLGEAYLASIEITRIFVIYALGRAVMFFMLPLYSSENHPEYGIWQGLLIFGLNLGLDLVLIPRYGTVGAAMAGVFAVSVVSIGSAVFIQRRFGFALARPILLTYALYGVSYLIGERVHPGLGVLTYLALLVPLGLIRREDLRWFTEARRRELPPEDPR